MPTTPMPETKDWLKQYQRRKVRNWYYWRFHNARTYLVGGVIVGGLVGLLAFTLF